MNEHQFIDLLAEKDAEIKRLNAGLFCPECCATEWNGAARARNERDDALAEVERLRGVVATLPQWEEMSDGYLVTTGERVRCEVGTETDDAIELTASEAMDGNPIRDLFRGQAARYYRVTLG